MTSICTSRSESWICPFSQKREGEKRECNLVRQRAWIPVFRSLNCSYFLVQMASLQHCRVSYKGSFQLPRKMWAAFAESGLYYSFNLNDYFTFTSLPCTANKTRSNKSLSRLLGTGWISSADADSLKKLISCNVSPAEDGHVNWLDFLLGHIDSVLHRCSP